ncbi:hypothetical protein LD125_00220 [Mesoplasma sp. JKS002658]|uniref:YceD family protein n=1 Tax=Mesoplasma whartonense TaxID=2878854 RepID=UPI002022AE33|nr:MULTISPECIES: YceD family protein [unclassified Mesoplasma]MCL8211269.1 hypothetical protein [Mesoplasma sp. JKS002664]MCL8211930.1 hypothetical protein [Mesoplasma sp. JKS002662]MCL8213965.1 hypothetical protein [Mesoplasma sp. JKS002658]MCL8214607.1 hypothetical protein [Mesoplasma sp. JKS002663]MCL8215284.1 hypothetical protein [Mesoplasma sp. JKS002659]
MRKKTIRQAKEKIHLHEQLTDLAQYEIHSPLISRYLGVKYEGDVFYDQGTDAIIVNAIIDYQIEAIDARDGAVITHTDRLEWDDEYSFDPQTKENVNLIVDEEVDFSTLAIEQINASIPINLTHNHGIISKTGSGWSLMSEEEYENDRSKQPDPRWEKLKEFNSSNDSKRDEKK